MIRTGMQSYEGATHLQIAYSGGKTYVQGMGEEENSDPWKYNGEYTPRAVLMAYTRDMAGEERTDEPLHPWHGEDDLGDG